MFNEIGMEIDYTYIYHKIRRSSRAQNAVSKNADVAGSSPVVGTNLLNPKEFCIHHSFGFFIYRAKQHENSR